MKPWWERYPAKLEAELAALRERGLDFFTDEQELAAGRIVLHGAAPAGRLGIIDVSIVYPDCYPHQRPTIFQVAGERLDRHQDPFGGSYCLLGRDPGQWQPRMCAADLLDRLPELVGLVDACGAELRAAEDTQGEPVTAYYGTIPNGCILVPDWVDEIDPQVIGGRLKVRFNTAEPFLKRLLQGQGRAPFGQGLLIEMTDEEGQPLGGVDPAVAQRFGGPVWAGRWVRIPTGTLPADNPIDFLQDLHAIDPRVGARGGGVSDKGGWNFHLHAALFSEEVRQDVSGQSLLFVGHATKRPPKRKTTPQHHASLIRAHRYSPDALAERIAPLQQLRERHVSLLGLGSLGAPLAQLLTQAQVGTLTVADHDVTDPGTAVRWPAGLPAAGVRKTDYLRADLGRHHPHTEIRSVQIRVGGTPPPGRPEEQQDGDLLEQLLTGVDLIIDATADDGVSYALCEAAREHQLTQIYLYGIDGYGGVVARIRPGQTGCYTCLQFAFKNGTISPPPAAADSEATRVQPRGCADPTFVAAAPDLLPLSNQAARVALSTLTSSDEAGYGAIGDDVFVLSLRHPDGTPLAAPSWQAHRLPVAPECWYCAR